jgi:23S rRNA (pseudouridine1915-N3)-methyltransferase
VKLVVLKVGERSPAWSEAAVEEYAKRLRRNPGIEEIAVKPEAFRGDVEAVRAAESQRVLDALKPRDFMVALDERGAAPDTDAFGALLDEGLGAPGRLVFVLGGAYGHHERLRAAAWRTIRLSSLVLNHEVARIVLFEQLYRVVARKSGVPYHH